MRKKWRNHEILLKGIDSTPIPIVADAGIATCTIGEGRIIPLVIIDTSARPDIEDLVRAHEKLPPGDAGIRWGQLKESKDKIALIIQFKRPSEAMLILEFNINNQGGLIDFILNAKALYIQPGREGERFVATMENSRILVEIPEIGFQDAWNDIWQEAIVKELRKRGLSRTEAEVASRECISSMREISTFRMK